jgi:hypothetical protein
LSINSAVASAPANSPQVAMSPAPTNTTSSEGEKCGCVLVGCFTGGWFDAAFFAPAMSASRTETAIGSAELPFDVVRLSWARQGEMLAAKNQANEAYLTRIGFPDHTESRN